MTPPAGTPLERDIATVRDVGGWVALLIAALTSNGLAQLGATLLSGAKPKFGLDQAEVIWNAFLLTAPLSVTVMLAAFVVFRGWLPDTDSAGLVLAAVLVVVGLVGGSLLYAAFGTELQAQGSIDPTSLRDLLQRPGAWQQKVLGFIVFVIVGYYTVFGPAHFIAGIAAGFFAAYATNKLAFGRRDNGPISPG
jgi:hypothetical protein